MPKIAANGIEVHYQQRGEGQDVVLIHGITSSLAMWYNGILPALSPEFRVTAYDLRGHGLSTITPNGYTSFGMAQDLKAVLDALGLEKVAIVGHSFGGALSMHFALLYPERVRGVVMLDSGLACLRYLRIIQDWSGWEGRPADMKERGLTLDQFLELDSKQDVTDFLRHGLSVPRRAGFKKGKAGLTERQRRLLEETRMVYEFRDVAGMTEDLLATVQTPILALYGETSPYKKMAAHLAKVLPQCCHDVFPGSGHFYAIHRPALVVERVAPFLRDPQSFIRQRALQEQGA